MLKEHCPHCEVDGWAFKYLLTQTPLFNVVCDVHPLREGHLLIIPKRHVRCAAEYTAQEWKDFKRLYEDLCQWLHTHYGFVATFEHGILGQTVFHSHIHLLPFAGAPEEVVVEGMEKCRPLAKLEDLITIFLQEERYLFFSIREKMWVVDPALGAPRFFRDRFAAALGCQERANWKLSAKDPALMAASSAENRECKRRFDVAHSTLSHRPIA